MGSSNVTAEYTNPEVFPWLKTLPLAPEYHPTIQEFQDPIAYIFKIEKEASQYGICKIVPPLPPQSKKSVITNLNKALSQQNPNSPPTFTTRQQQIGFCPRKHRPIQKPVWQSGEHYTVQQFEAKAKSFERSYLKNRTKKTLSPLEIETLYWKANGDRPFSVEYANDMPGSAFPPMKEKKTGEIGVSMVGLGDTAWNMRGAARANGSLLRFMKEDIPGVTSPMVYLAMLFSWFAWHVEDHDLHSLNYLHFGAPKTWYGVPRDAAEAFEEVIRVHGFGEEINPLVTFATLGEKTTVMSPQVLVDAGVPCCRLVQNAGEFVVTFPRAYHCGFSHGFNCAEASNIATPEWLRFAKDAAIRRASINYPPMVSHFQLLYDLALAICSRVPMSNSAEPRSSRLKDKKKGEGETLVKQMFVQDVIQNNELLDLLGQGSEVVLLPHNSSEKFVWSNLRVGSKYKVKPGLPFSLYSSEEAIKASDDIMLARDVNHPKAFYSSKEKSAPIGQKSGVPSHSSKNSLPFGTQHCETEKDEGAGGDGLSDRGLFSCVKCGIWTFACVAIVQPTETAAQYLMSADCNFFNDWIAGSGASSHLMEEGNPSEPDSFSGSMDRNAPNGLYETPVRNTDYQHQIMDNSSMMRSTVAENIKLSSDIENKEVQSALGLLAMTYGNSSDSDEENELPNHPTVSVENMSGDDSCGARVCHNNDYASPTSFKGYDRGQCLGSPRSECEYEGSPQRFDSHEHCPPGKTNSDHDSEYDGHDCSTQYMEEDTMTSERIYSPNANEDDNAKGSNVIDPVGKPNVPFARGCDEDSSRIHVFCLEHAVEVEKQLRPIGGVHILLLCHPDYPKVQIEAKKVAEELEMDYIWKDIAFSEATKEDEEWIQLALQSAEATPKNGDWAVKLGINLFYSAILSRSPLYNKQMPYNSVIYSVFGCTSPSKSSSEAKLQGRGFGRQKKLVVAGKWCGKVWMSNQVHPLLVERDSFEEGRAVNACLKSDEKTSRKPETSRKAQTAPTYRKVARKRKSTSESKPVKKLKFEAREFADSEPEDLVDDKPEFEPRRRSARKPKTQHKPTKKVKPREEEIPESGSEDSMASGPLLSSWARAAGGLRRAKPTLKTKGKQRVTTETSFSDGSEEDIRTAARRTMTDAKPFRKPKSRLKAVTVDHESEEGSLDDEAEADPRVSAWHTTKEFGPISDEDEMEGGPSTRLRKRVPKAASREIETTKSSGKKQLIKSSKGKKAPPPPARKGPKMRLPTTRTPAVKRGPTMMSDEEEEEEEEEEERAEFCCDIEGCTMSFRTKQELAVHKRNVCPVKGCGKKFFSHKYLVQHRRVHMDDRPLKCPWKGCRMTFKWAWARTEHIRVHTGARPYVCNEPGCGQTFRFVSDFSRHKRKTGHSAKKTRK